LPRLTSVGTPRRYIGLALLKEATRQLGSEVSHPATPVATIVRTQHNAVSAIRKCGVLSINQFIPIFVFEHNEFLADSYIGRTLKSYRSTVSNLEQRALFFS
jgi:hypothetical protein